LIALFVSKEEKFFFPLDTWDGGVFLLVFQLFYEYSYYVNKRNN
jgi:hypothetical protein